MAGDQSTLISGKTQASKTQNSGSLVATDNQTEAFPSHSLSWACNSVTFSLSLFEFQTVQTNWLICMMACWVSLTYHPNNWRLHMCRQGRHHVTRKEKKKKGSFTSCRPSIGVRNLIVSSYPQKLCDSFVSQT